MGRCSQLVADIFICFIADHANCSSAQWSQSTLKQFSGPLSNIKELLRTDNKTYFTRWKPVFRLQRAIEFVDVDFGYDASELVLHNTHQPSNADK